MNPTLKKSKYVLFALAALTALFPLATTYYGHSYDLPGVGIDQSALLTVVETDGMHTLEAVASSLLAQTGVAWTPAQVADGVATMPL